MSKLRDDLLDRGTVAAISREVLRRILRSGGVSWQSTSTWKAATNPDFMARMHRILALYDHPPDAGRVICANEFGLQPRKGQDLGDAHTALGGHARARAARQEAIGLYRAQGRDDDVRRVRRLLDESAAG